MLTPFLCRTIVCGPEFPPMIHRDKACLVGEPTNLAPESVRIDTGFDVARPGAMPLASRRRAGQRRA